MFRIHPLKGISFILLYFILLYVLACVHPKFVILPLNLMTWHIYNLHSLLYSIVTKILQLKQKKK